MPHHPTTKQVLAFLAVARHLQFTRAADDLNMSQPAVTSQIATLEQALGLRLFERTKREVALTTAGRALRPIMESIAERLDELVASSSDLGRLRMGKLRLAVLPSVAAGPLPQALKPFRERFPRIEVEISDVVAQDIMRMVKEDQVDFGIGLRTTPDRDVIVGDYLTDELCVFHPRDHPLAGCPSPCRLGDIARHPQILTKPGSSVRQLVDRALTAAGCEVSIAMEAGYMSTALGAVRAGMGVAILPLSARHAGDVQGLAWQRIGTRGLLRRIQILTRRNRDLPGAASALIQILRDQASLPEDRLSGPAGQW